MAVTIAIFFDTRRIKKKTNTYPIKLRVTHERSTRYYPTVFSLSKEDYDKLSAPRLSIDLQVMKAKLQEIERTAGNTIQEFDPFSFSEFERDYIVNNTSFEQKKFVEKCPIPEISKFDYTPFYKKFPILTDEAPEPVTIGSVYLSFIKSLLQEGRIGTASNYHSSYVSLKKFNGNVRFADVTVSYLKQYEQVQKNKELSRSTIGIYLRALRAIFNEAAANGIIRKEKCYPFGKRKYRIPTSRNVKKALELSEVEKIYYYKCDPQQPSEQKGKDFWLFCYFANGINIKDLAFLKYKNIQGEQLIFERAKTENTMRSDPKPIIVYITEDMWEIIDRRGNKDKNPNNYIFPILEPGLSPLRQYELVQLFVSFVNEWMRRIAAKLGISKKTTTYVARHTFSTVLKRAGASTEYIQEALGHTDLKTTENYLDSFGSELKKELAGRLTAFSHLI